VAAELARLEGQELEAERLYEQAIEGARGSGLVHEEALACERAAAFHRARGFARIAAAYLADAHAAYTRWGAAGKVRRLQDQHPALRAAAEAAVPIDTLAVVKATQAVSGQIDAEALLDTLMRIALEQAGAQAGRLYVTDGERLELAASAEVCGEALDVQVPARGTTVADGDDTHPSAVLNYVRRTCEQVLVDDVMQPHPFAGDPYLRRRQPRSVLCVPLLRQSRTIGVLYLEHLLGTHAFTPQRATVLGMLAAQAAISLETSRLYAALKEENEQRRRAEAATLEWQARIGRLVDSNIIAVRISDLDGRIIEANDAYLRMVGYTREDMTAGLLTTQRVTPAEYAADDERAKEELLRMGRYTPYEKEYVRKDGTRVPVLAGGILFQGEQPQTVGFVLDLSERRRAESEQRARQAAEAASEAKSAFLATMSHELRTPLNAVLGYAQLLRRDATLTERQSKGLATIEASGKHLLALINDVLDLARIEAGKLELEPVPVSLSETLALIADIARVRAEEKSLELLLDMPPPLPASVQVDERRLRQVLLNLLGNAVKFTHAGRVALRLRARPHGAASWTLAFEVEDTGVGMSAAELERIFQPFEQAGGARQRAQGAGLGLAISDALVRRMGGRITVRSEPDRGSTFSFELVVPGTSAVREASGDLAPTECLGLRRRVLVVDDLAENRAVLVDLLKSLDFETAEAATGAQALTQAHAMQPHLVLIDNRMPDTSGSEVTRRLRAQESFANLPVIAVSAGASPQEQASCIAAGANAFLPKPVDIAELIRTIAKVLDLNSSSPPGVGRRRDT
jgi:PAS domain S-box-containing protein